MIYQSIRIAQSWGELVKALTELGGVVDSSGLYTPEELIYYIKGYIVATKTNGINHYKTKLVLKAIPEIGGLRQVVKRLIERTGGVLPHISIP